MKANKLSSHRKIDYSIELQLETLLSIKRVYEISREQVIVIKEYMKKMLRKNYIRSSIFSYIAPMLIVKKLDDDLRICVNYRALNALTIRNRNASPLIRDTLVKLCIIK